jgi:hypothetical protein
MTQVTIREDSEERHCKEGAKNQVLTASTGGYQKLISRLLQNDRENDGSKRGVSAAHPAQKLRQVFSRVLFSEMHLVKSPLDSLCPH